MKRIAILSLGLFVGMQLTAQPVNVVLRFRGDTAFFGKIIKGKQVKTSIGLTNVTDQPLVIEAISSDWKYFSFETPVKSIAPGKEAEIILLFNAAIAGAFDKKITLQLNGVRPETKVFAVRGLVVDPEVLAIDETKPSVNLRDWRRHLESHLPAVITKAAKRNMPSGYHTLSVRFMVEEDGKLSVITILNDPGYDIANDIIGIVKKGPKWKPGQQNGKPVRSYHTQPIIFSISEQ